MIRPFLFNEHHLTLEGYKVFLSKFLYKVLHKTVQVYNLVYWIRWAM